MVEMNWNKIDENEFSEENILITVGKKVYKLRKEENITQAVFAKRLNIKSRAQISTLERGKARYFSLKTLARICEVAGKELTINIE